MSESLRQPFPGVVPDGFTYHWLHRPRHWPRVVPDDVFYTYGAGVNFCIVAPGLDLVAARVGENWGADMAQVMRDFAVRLFSAVAGRPDLPADTSRPEVTVQCLADGDTVSGDVELRGTARDPAGIARVDIDVDGCGDARPTRGVWESDPSQGAEGPETSWVFDWDTKSCADGPHRLFIRAYDRAGNASAPRPPLVLTVANGGDNLVRRPCG